MRLLTSPQELIATFDRLLNQYSEYYWTTAWAGTEFKPFDQLVQRKEKITRMVVGIHFYQTHPDFIKEFVKNKNVRFVAQPSGTFHPKFYLFYDSKESWEIIVGSANFTKGAFKTNTEASILVSSNDDGANELLVKAMDLVNSSWKSGKVFGKTDLANYTIAWNNHRPKLQSLSGQYGSKKSGSKPIHDVRVLNRSWKEFMDLVRRETTHGMERRLRVIEIAQSLFRKAGHFNELDIEERKFISGIPNKLHIDGAEDWAFFGSMKGAGVYKNMVINNDLSISNALDEIPLSGQITRVHYDRFIQVFSMGQPGNRLATATRLLAMKRPDTFLCFDSKNKSELCSDFGIVQSGMNYERYWEEIIERIYDSEWWMNPSPKNDEEKKVANARAAFLDSLYYIE